MYLLFTSTCPLLSLTTVIVSFTRKGAGDNPMYRFSILSENATVHTLNLSIFRILVYLVIYDSG